MNSAFVSRLERVGTVPSTQPIVSEWLRQGTPEVAVAVADEQTRGRGRQGREWHAPRGAALLVSLGFRPTGLALGHAWRLGAVVAMAMLDAVKETLDAAGWLEAANQKPPAAAQAYDPRGRAWLKWPNDLVVEGADGSIRKLAGVLGETVAADGRIEQGVVGIGLNVDWAAADFPADLAASMTSLRELVGGESRQGDASIDRDAILERFLAHLEPAYEALRAGRFDAEAWAARQVTSGRRVEIDVGGERLEGTAHGVDTESGSLLVESGARVRAVDSGEVVRCRVLDMPGPL